MCDWSMYVVFQEIDGYMKHAGDVVINPTENVMNNLR